MQIHETTSFLVGEGGGVVAVKDLLSYPPQLTVKLLYRVLLHRDGTKEEIAYHVNLLESHQATKKDLIRSFYESQECDREEVTLVGNLSLTLKEKVLRKMGRVV